MRVFYFANVLVSFCVAIRVRIICLHAKGIAADREDLRNCSVQGGIVRNIFNVPWDLHGCESCPDSPSRLSNDFDANENLDASRRSVIVIVIARS